MSGLSDLARMHARAQPHAEFLCFETADGAVATWSYAAFDAMVDELAAGLESAGLQIGDSFLVRMRNHPVIVALVLAASRTGTVAVPVDPALSAREVQICAEIAQACLLVERQHGLGQATGLPVWDVDGPVPGTRLGAPPRCLGRRAEVPGGVVELLFTSGTTSLPKAVMITEAAVRYGAATLAAAAGYHERDVPLIALSLFHAAAQMHQLWPTLLLGGRVALVERFSASRFAAQAVRHGATTSAQFAASLRMLLLRGQAEPCSGLRHMTFAQNLTAHEHAEWDRRFGVPLQQLWGMTETVGLPIMSPLAEPRRLEAMGKAVPGYRVEVDNLGSAPNGDTGELIVQADPGRTVTLGYFRDAAATTALVRDGWLRSGDIARRDREDFFHFVGRHADIIRRAGVNFSALEVEDVLRSVPGVADAAVVGMPDPVLDERVAAAVVVVRGRVITEDLLHAHCAEKLANYKCPEVFHFVEELPRTSVGKVRKHVLAEQLAALPGAPSQA